MTVMLVVYKVDPSRAHAGVGQGGIEQPQREGSQGERGIVFRAQAGRLLIRGLTDRALSSLLLSAAARGRPGTAEGSSDLPRKGSPRMTEASRLMLEGSGVKRG